MPLHSPEGHEPSKEKFELTPKSAEFLEVHEDVQIFKEGMYREFLRQVQEQGIEATEEEKQDYFENLWKKDKQHYVQVVLSEGYAEDSQEFVVATQRYFDRDAMGPLLNKFLKLPKTEQARADVDANVLFYFLEGSGKIDVEWPVKTYKDQIFTKEQYVSEVKKLEGYLQNREAQPKPWWEGKVFIQRESGHRYVAVGVTPRAMGKGDILVLKKEGGYTEIGKPEERFKQAVETPGGDWSMEDIEKPKSAEVKAEAKDWREVKREVEVDAVGDLHGSFEGFKENLKSLGAVQEKAEGRLEWVGENKKVVLLGDILADRGIQGMDILLAIADLREQAEKQGGSIDVLAGNHDDFFTSYLMNRPVAGTPEGYVGDAVENSRLSGQGMGLLELSKYGSSELKAMLGKSLNFRGEGKLVDMDDRDKEAWEDLKKINDLSPAWDKLKEERELILKNMRNDPKGRKVLEVICSMKLAEKADDTLFVHTNPANGMTKYLFKPGDIQKSIDYVNDFYQRNLRAVLLEGKEPEQGFDGLRGLFLNTSNRSGYSENEYEMEFISNEETETDKREAKEKEIINKVQDIRRQGINAIVHGHTDEGFFAVRGERLGLPVISIDTSAFKKWGKKDKRSILKIAKDGKMQRAEKMEFIRQ